jgi:outer membrane lipoprotein-sorting protein
MSYLLRRAPLSRLLLLCGLVVALGASLTALAFALGSGPIPPERKLADAVHDALSAEPVEGVSAQIQLTDRLLEGANLASGSGGPAGQLSSSPLLTGASGRLWIAKNGGFRLELQSQQGDTQIYGSTSGTISMYDTASNTLYRYKVPAHGSSWHRAANSSTPGSDSSGQGSPSVAKIEEAISKLSEHAEVSGAEPTDIAGQAAYTVRVSPKEKGSLLGGAQLSWDAGNGVPLRAAIYSTDSSVAVLELAATSISYGPIESSVLEFEAPANAKIEEVVLPEHGPEANGSGQDHEPPKLTTFGKGISTIAVLEGKATGSGQASAGLPEGVQQVKVGNVTASELSTQLGTLLSFERDGVRYLIAGAVEPSAVEAVAKGL